MRVVRPVACRLSSFHCVAFLSTLHCCNAVRKMHFPVSRGFCKVVTMRWRSVGSPFFHPRRGKSYRFLAFDSPLRNAVNAAPQLQIQGVSQAGVLCEHALLIVGIVRSVVEFRLGALEALENEQVLPLVILNRPAALAKVAAMGTSPRCNYKRFHFLSRSIYRYWLCDCASLW